MSFAKHRREAATTMFAYGVSSTTITYGLPRGKQRELMNGYRERHLRNQVRLLRAKAKSRGVKEQPAPNMEAYDLCCEYYQQVYTMQAASSNALYGAAEAYDSPDAVTESDSDSVSVASSMPSLEEGESPSEPFRRDCGCPVCPTADTANANANTETAVADTETAVADTGNTPETTAAAASLQKGERYCNLETPLTIPVAELPESLDLPEAQRTTFHTDGEAIEQVWALLNQVNRPDYTDMIGRGRRTDIENYTDYLTHRLKIFGRGGARVVRCRCTNGKHAAFERRQAYAFTDGSGNLVVKKSKSLLLALP
ncbi:hypothetical protein B0H16DRAFT_1741232 [Mycena metata]|uniref:Uncharacterized protein n=1 Tax=Mycena metata TaxID=1033252 RepID=A0AAD7MGL4_9AGAR|nr:hypothetical protein B0H16DRAFT_1741232 [Mycena metata]